MTSENGQKRIKVDYMARVEGEGALDIIIEGDEIKHLELNIFEPPRFFEAFLRGRDYWEAPDITARICGICPVAYQMSSVHAMEKILEIEITPEIRRLRRLLYCAEWIESHALHIFLLHAPDFLGYESAISMAAVPALLPTVEMGLRMKKIGNDLLATIGGREVHPVTPTVGGFYRAPTLKELQALKEDFEWGLEAAISTVAWTATLDFPDFAPDYEVVSLSHPDEYPMNEGRVVSNKGLDIPVEEFEQYFLTEHVAHSNAVQVHRDHGGSYQTGPLARVNLNLDKLSPQAQKAMQDTGIEFPNNNPFISIVSRSIEVVHAFEEALEIIDSYERPVPSRITAVPQAGVGCHITEAPRGMCYHRYRIDDQGIIQDVRIDAPTAQNLRRMEDDLRAFVPQVLDLPLEDATWRCEQLVRNYDPCISCATHFLKLNIQRR
ncbi:MAG: Ni/Fe hydrogenase subunit alpha [Chloroflexota bacterium]|nr:Ni/Fe hydrogenase subunit alpha [Chloroflexota bacterium]